MHKLFTVIAAFALCTSLSAQTKSAESTIQCVAVTPVPLGDQAVTIRHIASGAIATLSTGPLYWYGTFPAGWMERYVLWHVSIPTTSNGRYAFSATGAPSGKRYAFVVDCTEAQQNYDPTPLGERMVKSVAGGGGQ